MNGYSALRQYQQAGAQSGVLDASPHRLVTMLMDGALERISVAKGHMDRNEVDKKGQRIGAAISIVEELRSSLDMERGGQVAANLANLYEYISHRLLEANLKNCKDRLDEVSSLLRELKEAWVAIPVELHYGARIGAGAAPAQRVAHA